MKPSIIKYCLLLLSFAAAINAVAQVSDSLPASTAAAASDSSVATTQESDSAFSFTLKGFGELDHITYFRHRDPTKVYSRNQGLLHLNLSGKLANKASFYSSIELRDDISDKSRNRIFLREAYANIFLHNLDIRVGKQIVNWGAADAINVTNNINPVDYRDLLDTRYQTIGVFSARFDYYLKNWKLTGVYVPIFNPSILPSMQSPWMESLPRFMPDPGRPGSFKKVSFGMGDALLPPRDIRSSQYAVKLSTTIKGWDASASYYNGYNDIPTRFNQVMQVVASDSLHILIQPEHNRWQVIGGDFSSSIGSFGIRGEAAYIITQNPDPTKERIKPYLQYVAGVDRNFSHVFGNNNLFVIAEWIQEIASRDQHFSSKDLNHLFQKSMLLRGELAAGNDAKISLQGIYNFVPKDFYLRPEFSFDIAEGLTATALADLLFGNAKGLFGSFKDNKRFQLRLKYSF